MNQEHIWNLIAKKLAGEASPVELEELEGLMKKHPDLHYPLQIITDLWKHNRHYIRQTAEDAFTAHKDRMAVLHVDFNTDGSHENIFDSKGFSLRKKKNIRGILLVVSAVLVIAVVMVKYAVSNYITQKPESRQKSLSEISTHNGSKTNVVLPDGTVVKLNGGSKLTYDKDYGNAIREVNLTGEAFFDVVKNKEKPFIIHTKKIDIKVIGTTFNVKSYPDETTETSLVKGSIEVTFKNRPSQKVILKPSEKLIVADDDLSLNPAKTKPRAQTSNPVVAISHLNYTRQDSTIMETAWVQNKLVFREEMFKELALQMERWYNVSVHFDNSDIQYLKFTGIFENETIQQALGALQLSGKFNYSMKDNEIFISK